ncbi:MAG: LON peptidase substrate-binding domain-containing protein, partial [Hungatella hathewayi]|nr:LON peptidase substrate-binding domain-containing protein [Hungatella hathewayi]
MERDIITVPVIALRGLTVLPRMMMHFDISRPKSILAVEKAMGGDQKVLLLTQRNPDDLDPEEEQLYHVGTLALVKQLVKMPGGI